MNLSQNENVLIKRAIPELNKLKEISNPPKTLFCLGKPNALDNPCIAIVGTRKPSIYGIRSALYFSKKLAELGFTIVSGLARGIDSYAHHGALMGKGKTVAILGHGLNRIYPSENRGLANRILDNDGALISEYEHNQPPLKHHFPQRNRIISGLSEGVLIIEAAEKSGSLITAYFALEQNREVFVVGSRFDETSFKGGNLLLQQGAKMVLTVEDILEELPFTPPIVKPKEQIPVHDFINVRDLFHKHHGVLTMGKIYNLPSCRRNETFKELYQAIEEHLVMEISPQVFVWVE